MNEAPLLQSGRARLDFLISASKANSRLNRAVDREIEALGLNADALPDDLDERDRLVTGKVAASDSFRTANAMQAWLGDAHGKTARAAFEAMEGQGPATLTVDPDLEMPDYYRDVWFHSTHGGWDGHEEQGYIHGEIVHRLMVAKIFPLGDIYASRRAVLADLPKDQIKDILELGTSSGQYTTALQQTFPEARITGIDFAAPMLRQAVRVANERGWAWDLRQMAAEATTFADDSFDLVTAYSFLHEMPETTIRAIYREALRVLRPGGILLIADITPFSAQDKMAQWRADRAATRGGEPHWRESASLDWAGIAREEGFTDAAGRGLGPHSFPWVVQGTKA